MLLKHLRSLRSVLVLYEYCTKSKQGSGETDLREVSSRTFDNKNLHDFTECMSIEGDGGNREARGMQDELKLN